MKSKIFTILFALTAILQFVACTNEEGSIDNSMQDLRISTSIESRAVITSTTFLPGDDIGVFLPEQTKKANVKVHCTYGNSWELSERIPLTANEEPVYAYYPYTEDYDGQNIPVHIDGCTDYLYGKSQGNVSMTNPEAHLIFKHALARITLSFKLGSANSSPKVLSEVILRNINENTAISNFGWMNITNGEIKEKATGNIQYKLADGEIQSNTTLNIEMLVIPTIIETDNQVEVACLIDGKQYVIPMPASTWEAGQQYTYPITINISKDESEEIDPSIPAKIGDYYYSDGTWSSDYKASKTCIGIVFALSKEQDGDIDVSLKESMHGRIVALQDLDKKYAWGSYGVDVEGISNYNNPAGTFYDETKGGYIVPMFLPIDGESQYYYYSDNSQHISANYTTWLTSYGYDWALTDYNGKQHTSFISDFDFPAANACYYKTMGEIASGFWYLPSCGEMGRLAMSCAIGIVSQANQPVFKNLATDLGNSYWTSTEKNSATAFVLALNGCTVGDGLKEDKKNVRPIASF